MVIYYIYIAYCLFASLCYRLSNFARKDRRRILTFFLWLGLFLIMALRADSVGNDLIRYIEQYKDAVYVSTFRTSTEFGYVIFEKLLNLLTIGQQGFIIVVSLIISSSFSWFFYKYSKQITFSFLLFLTIGIFSFSMTGIRQSLALSIILFATHFAVKRNLFVFVLLTLVAATFHYSALIFLPAYLIFKNKFDSFRPLIFFIICLIALVTLDQYAFSYLHYLSMDQYGNYLDNSNKSEMNVLVVAFRAMFPTIVIILWLIQKKKITEIKSINISFFFMSLISLIFTILSLNLSIVNRLSLYFFVGVLILIPNTVDEFREKNKPLSEILQFILLLICILSFVISTTGGITKIDKYHFFWY